MRLLQCTHDGGVSLTRDIDETATPPYAILSHTWGAEADEVTFDDIESDTGKAKPGYKKIEFCGRQAEQDGLQYFWVDTCCINKANKAEFSHAINSMYRWYRNSVRCYVYLVDVYDDVDGLSPPLWDTGLRKSRWFTRGWTLQELLAPHAAEFFTHNWQKLGDKVSLRQYIHEITGISLAVLDGAPLAQLDVEERLSWNVHRCTTLEEDKIYSLLGIFDVYLSPFYGEGASKARDRLMDQIKQRERCIQDLRHGDPRDDKKRIEESKGGLLVDAYCWIFHNATFQQWRSDLNSQLLWIKGDPGKGKTMLLCGIINELRKTAGNNITISYFFCQAIDPRINTAVAVLRGLLYMIVDQRPSLISHVRKKYDRAGKSLFEDANTWAALKEMFADVLRDPNLGTTYLIIDALDECLADMPKLLDFLVGHSSTSSHVKWIVASRNWPDIEERLERADHKVRLSLELNTASVSTAVSNFIKQKVAWLAQQKKYNDQTRDAVLEHLLLNANDTFLWVSLVCQHLEETAKRNVLKKLSMFPPGLDSLYQRMMQQINKSDDAELCKQVLSSLTLMYRPVTWQELVAVVEQLECLADDVDSIQEIIGLCGSFLTLREDRIYFVHQSAKDFLLNKAAAEIFPSGREDVHYKLFARSLQTMFTTLRRDMYSVNNFGYSVEEIQQPDPDPLAALRYSCIYWVDHLIESKSKSFTNYEIDSWDKGAIENFIRKKYLYWLEALSLFRSMSQGVLIMGKLNALAQKSASPSSFTKLLQDARLFIFSHIQAIQNSPLQVYMSALVFSPECSDIKVEFKKEKPKWITVKPAIENRWNACLQTLKGHSSSVNSLAFSPDSTRLASGSHDCTAKIWDASSGECLQTLRGHIKSVFSVAFSPDSTRLASGSFDHTVKIWDASSGECLQTLTGHSSSVSSVAFSPGSTRLASGSSDDTVKIWDANSGECLQTLKGYSSSIESINFSPDSTWLASGSYDHTVKIWCASSGECLQTLRGHSNFVSSVAFSPDSTRLASGSFDETVKTWDARSGECLQTLESHGGYVYSVAFSPDSTCLASGLHNHTVKIWDASSGECLQTFKGHDGSVCSVAFSPDSTRLASGSYDDTVKIWNANSSEYLQAPTGHSNSVYSLAFSPDLTRLASSALSDDTVKIWDASNGECLQTLKGHGDSANSLAFSPDSTWLASGSSDHTVKIWDTSSSECLQTLRGHRSVINSVAFSSHSTWLASASDDTVKIWDVSSGKCLQTLKSYGGSVCSVSFSPNSTRLASGSYNHTVNIWDASSGECLQTLKGCGGSVESVAFSPDSTQLASGSYDQTVKIWDTSSGECLQTFRGHSSSVNSVVFSPDWTRRASRSYDNMVKQGPDVSSDDTWITTNSKNLLWLPLEYRPFCVTVYQNKIGIGTRNGRVWICEVECNEIEEF